MIKKINTSNAPAAIGPYAQAMQYGNLIFTSGQLGIDPKNGEMPNGVSQQTRLSLDNLKSILESAGSSLGNVIKTTVFLKNMDDFATVNEIYAAYFQDHTPARSCVQVAKLPKDGLVEIEAIAEIK